MENGEKRTNYEQRQLPGGQCTNFSLHTSLLRKSLANGEQLPGLGTVHHFYPFIRNFAKLSVMENQEDGDPCSRTPGLGEPYEYGDGHGSCAQ